MTETLSEDVRGLYVWPADGSGIQYDISVREAVSEGLVDLVQRKTDSEGVEETVISRSVQREDAMKILGSKVLELGGDRPRYGYYFQSYDLTILGSWK